MEEYKPNFERLESFKFLFSDRIYDSEGEKVNLKSYWKNIKSPKKILNKEKEIALAVNDYNDSGIIKLLRKKNSTWNKEENVLLPFKNDLLFIAYGIKWDVFFDIKDIENKEKDLIYKVSELLKIIPENEYSSKIEEIKISIVFDNLDKYKTKTVVMTNKSFIQDLCEMFIRYGNIVLKSNSISQNPYMLSEDIKEKTEKLLVEKSKKGRRTQKTDRFFKAIYNIQQYLQKYTPLKSESENTISNQQCLFIYDFLEYCNVWENEKSDKVKVINNYFNAEVKRISQLL